MKLFFVTSNKHKLNEIQMVLRPLGIELEQKNLSVKEPEKFSVEETASSKAEQAFKELKKPLITEDTGIYFNALGDFPGAKAKRVFRELGYAGLFKKIGGKERGAFFETVICYVNAKGEKRGFSGVCTGTITEKVFCKEKDVLPYERIFIPQGYSEVMASIPREEKNSFSHRGKAAKKLAEFLANKT